MPHRMTDRSTEPLALQVTIPRKAQCSGMVDLGFVLLAATLRPALTRRFQRVLDARTPHRNVRLHAADRTKITRLFATI